MRAVMPAMRERGAGTIINVSTVAVQAAFGGTGGQSSALDIPRRVGVERSRGRPYERSQFSKAEVAWVGRDRGSKAVE